MSESTPPTPASPAPKQPQNRMPGRKTDKSGHQVVLEGDELLRELRQGWKGLPNKTLFSLAIGGLRVRMMRSSVTMLSIVLAIAFLTYTGLSSTVNYRLVQVAEHLGDESVSNAAQNAEVRAASARLASLDLLGKLDVNALKREAAMAGLDNVTQERKDLPIAIRDLSRTEDSTKDTINKFETLSKASGTLPADLNMARSQVEMANRELAAAQRNVQDLQAKVDMGKWIDSNTLPVDTTEEQMTARVRELLTTTYQDLLTKIKTPGRLNNENLNLLSRPLALASTGEDEHRTDAATLHQAVERVVKSRQSVSLLNMLRRSGVNVKKTQEGNPMDVWLIVMALMTCAVGIANAMLMSVTERFREIGTMKCLGAQDNLVVKLFLLESAFLGVVGAAGGIVIGVTVSLLAAVLQFGTFGLGYFPVAGALPTIFWSVTGGVILSVVGAVYPALAASRMKPVDALRVDE